MRAIVACSVWLQLAFCAASVTAAQPQWWWRERIDIAGKTVDALLWTDPAGEPPRALLLTVRTFAEPSFCADPTIRTALARNRIALAMIAPSPFGGHDPPEPAWEKLEQVLKQLEKGSGLPGLAALPLIPFAHSSAGPWARNLTWHRPERMAGMIYYNSGKLVPPPWGSVLTKKVPVLAMNGEFEEFGPNGDHADGDDWEGQWKAMRENGLALRSQGQRIAFAVEPGAGHYFWTGRQAPLVAAFLDATGRSLERGRESNGEWGYPDAWLADSAIKNPEGFAAKPLKSYQGPPDRAWWMPDAAFAKAWEEAHRGCFDRMRQYVRFESVVKVQYERDFLDPGVVIDSATGSVTPAAKSSEGLAVDFSVIEGPAERDSQGRFRLKPALFRGAPSTKQRIRLRGFSTGDENHAYAEREAELEFFPSAGTPNALRFELPETIREGDGPLKLVASSDARGPVDFAVIAGPAEVRDGELVLLPTPRASQSAEFPIIISAGHGGGGGYAAAVPVERKIRLLRASQR